MYVSFTLLNYTSSTKHLKFLAPKSKHLAHNNYLLDFKFYKSQVLH